MNASEFEAMIEAPPEDVCFEPTRIPTLDEYGVAFEIIHRREAAAAEWERVKQLNARIKANDEADDQRARQLAISNSPRNVSARFYADQQNIGRGIGATSGGYESIGVTAGNSTYSYWRNQPAMDPDVVKADQDIFGWAETISKALKEGIKE